MKVRFICWLGLLLRCQTWPRILYPSLVHHEEAAMRSPSRSASSVCSRLA